jgi:hypothetical protein
VILMTESLAAALCRIDSVVERPAGVEYRQ